MYSDNSKHYCGKTTYGKVIDPGATPRTGDNSQKPAKFVFDNPRIANWKGQDDVWMLFAMVHLNL